MPKTAIKLIYVIIMGLALAVSMAVSAGAVEIAGINDKVELKKGNTVTGTILNDTFTVSTPYTHITLKKDQISEIKINPENEDYYVIVLNVGGTLDGKIEDPNLSIRLPYGKIITIDMKRCKKVIMGRKTK